MADIDYLETGIRDIELIRPLWILLNGYHYAKAGIFRDYYRVITFDDRREYLEKRATEGKVLLELAFDRSAAIYVAYCVSSLSNEKNGEIESVFVREENRNEGVGSELVSRSLAWLEANGSVRNRVSVADGNEDAFSFYRRFGFYPRMAILEQKKE